MSLKSVKTLFLVAGWYDLVLGVIFGLFFRPIYERFGSTLPNHDAYVQLPAILIAIFGIGFLMVSRGPQRNQSIIALGILMKLGFCGVVLGHVLFGSTIPFYIPFAVLDAVFAALFALANSELKKNRED